MLTDPFIKFYIQVILVLVGYAICVYIKAKELEIKSLDKSVYVEMESQIETINQLLNLIDNHIALEVAYRLKEQLSLGVRYNALNMDKDVEIISRNIYESFNPSMFIQLQKRNPVYNNEFWMHYIANKTFCSLMAAIQNSNGDK